MLDKYTTSCKFSNSTDCKICQLEHFINRSWFNLLIEEFSKEYFIILKEKLHHSKEITPNIEDIFSFTNYIDFDMIKVIIVGQDPYSTPNKACGVAFASKDKTISYSLNTIFRSIRNNYPATSLNAESPFKWISQGVLLINTHLTCEINKPNSHKKIGWFNFIRSLLLKFKKKKNLVYLLCGKESHKLSSFINRKENYVINGSHPGHFTATKFIYEESFLKINNYLQYKNIEKIYW